MDLAEHHLGRRGARRWLFRSDGAHPQLRRRRDLHGSRRAPSGTAFIVGRTSRPTSCLASSATSDRSRRNPRTASSNFGGRGVRPDAGARRDGGRETRLACDLRASSTACSSDCGGRNSGRCIGRIDRGSVVSRSCPRPDAAVETRSIRRDRRTASRSVRGRGCPPAHACVHGPLCGLCRQADRGQRLRIHAVRRRSGRTARRSSAGSSYLPIPRSTSPIRASGRSRSERSCSKSSASTDSASRRALFQKTDEQFLDVRHVRVEQRRIVRHSQLRRAGSGRRRWHLEHSDERRLQRVPPGPAGSHPRLRAGEPRPSQCAGTDTRPAGRAGPRHARTPRKSA